MKKIYFDENIPIGLAHGMANLDKSNNQRSGQCELIYMPDVLGKGVKDSVWIPVLAKEGAVVITYDYNIHRDNIERGIYQKNGLGLVVIRMPSKKGATYWERVQLLIKQWEEIRKVCVQRNPPFLCICNANRVTVE
jgi:hypothetical protein